MSEDTSIEMGGTLSKTEQALCWFELESIDGVTLDELKRRFKRALATHHPDRGGKEGDFEAIIDAYEYVSLMIKRTMGGREGASVIDVADLVKQREREFVTEMNNMIADVFDEVDRRQLDDFHITFNSAFQKRAKPLTDDGGYNEWLGKTEDPHVYSSTEELKKQVEEQLLLRGLGKENEPLDDIKMDLPLPSTFHQDFVTDIRQKYPDRAPSEAIILHPMEMAIVDGRCYGTDIIRRENRYHSSMYVNPEYTDLMEAYTSDNTIIDKLAVEESSPSMDADLDQLLATAMKERDVMSHPADNEEVRQIYEYERRYFEKEAKQKLEVESYFKTAGSATWALHDSNIQTIYRDIGDEKKEE